MRFRVHFRILSDAAEVVAKATIEREAQNRDQAIVATVKDLTSIGAVRPAAGEIVVCESAGPIDPGITLLGELIQNSNQKGALN